MRKSGLVRRFNATRGFGFIVPDDRGADCFVHITACQASGLVGLQVGDHVSYEETAGRDGPRAVNLALVKAAARR